MRRADFSSDAEYYRAHREVFLLAQELGCTPIEAERRMNDERVRMRHLAQTQRLDSKMNPRLVPGLPELRDAPEWGAPWMLQE